ncbi:MAG: 5'-methylthioadenosine/adenosylhomocysteine nucleosidase [Clostridiales bacterium]|nr:5'-methylthioadenosine/adenosylhomocysteine nucleosidase [Clostridiales bacterium]
MKIGIIGAMESEVTYLRDLMEELETTTVGIASFYTGKLYGVDTVLSQCGIGKIHAAMCAQAMILHYAPDMIINIGVAGALDERLDIGDIVVSRFGVQHDIDTCAFGDPLGCVPGINVVELPCDEKIIAAMEKACRQEKLTCLPGGVATGDQFIADLDRKNFLREHFGCAACDMEGGAIAQVCCEMKVPYGAYRAISDTLCGNEKEYSENVAVAALSSQKLLRAFYENL